MNTKAWLFLHLAFDSCVCSVFPKEAAVVRSKEAFLDEETLPELAQWPAE